MAHAGVLKPIEYRPGFPPRGLAGLLRQGSLGVAPKGPNNSAQGNVLGFRIDIKRSPFSTIQNRSRLSGAEVFFEFPACSQGVALG